MASFIANLDEPSQIKAQSRVVDETGCCEAPVALVLIEDSGPNGCPIYLYSLSVAVLSRLADAFTAAAAKLSEAQGTRPVPESAPCPVCSRELMPGEPCPADHAGEAVAELLREARQAAVNAPGSPIRTANGYFPILPLAERDGPKLADIDAD